VHPCGHIRKGVSEMVWETPTFVEVKMDAEINSYQEDFDDRL
jgi:coenzyme PQQ precursor peptide PqqA